MRTFFLTLSVVLFTVNVGAAELFKLGRYIMVQTSTSDTQTSINVLVPKLKNLVFKVTSSQGEEIQIPSYETVSYQPLHWKIEKLHITNLNPQSTYKLKVYDVFKGKLELQDEREFSTLDIQNKKTLKFAFGSCMSDDFRFDAIIDPMWNKIFNSQPDILVLNGDLVYVDGFEFVARNKATELDLWQRYVDAFKRLPIYRSYKLIPIFAAWDDHDYGTNDGDRNFASKDAATKVFKAFFRGKNIPGIFELSAEGNYFKFIGFNQALYMTDGRTYRQNKKETPQELYGHWGKTQHDWLLENLKADNLPSWIFGGDQFLNAKPLGFKETFEGDHPLNFSKFVNDLKNINQPFVLGSGDIHFSEVMKTNIFGFETYEFTSSAIHSFTMGQPWENPLRVISTSEFNFMLIESTSENNSLRLLVKAIGLSETPYFTFEKVIKK